MKSVKLLFVVAMSFLFFLSAGCGSKSSKSAPSIEFKAFGVSFHKLLSDPEGFETFVNNNKLVDDENYFKCLEVQRTRVFDMATGLINGCKNECGSDSGCNFHCNIRSGTEIVDGAATLIGLTRRTIHGEISYGVLSSNSSLIASLLYEGDRITRDRFGLPPLSFNAYWAENKERFVEEYTCIL